jgi:hypothetical protein
MKTIKKQITVTTERGTEVNMTVTAVRGYEEITEKVWVDEYVECKSKKEINETTIESVVNGVTYKGGLYTIIPEKYKSQGVHAILADKIGVSKAVYESLNAVGVHAILADKIGVSKAVYESLNAVIASAKAEAETDADWIAYKEMKKRALEEEEAYYKHAKNVEDMMTLNGKTY